MPTPDGRDCLISTGHHGFFKGCGMWYSRPRVGHARYKGFAGGEPGVLDLPKIGTVAAT